MINQMRNWIARGWLPLAVAALGLALLLGQPAWAAPHNQTVPLPTPTEAPEQPPAATPTPSSDSSSRDSDDDDDSDDGSATTAPAPALPDDLTGTVNAVRLNVREAPSADAAAIGTAGAGDQLDLLARSEDGTWWLICCVSEGSNGWVSAQFIAPNGASRAEANAALPQADAATGTTTAPAEADPAGAADAQTLVGLALTVEQSPALVQQGGTLTLRYEVENTGDEAATNVMLRSDVPAGLTLGSVDAPGAEQAETAIASGGTALLIIWSRLDAGAKGTAEIVYTVDEDVPDGRVIDLIAAGDAGNAESTSAGVTIAMPPADLPTFQ